MNRGVRYSQLTSYLRDRLLTGLHQLHCLLFEFFRVDFLYLCHADPFLDLLKYISAFGTLPNRGKITSLVQLIVERGTEAFKELPKGITGNKEAMAETIENNLRRVIIDEMPINPRYYEKMSELLDTLIQERKSQAQEYEQYLARIVELANQVQNPVTAYPKTLNTPAKRALYDNLGNDERLALDVDAAIQSKKKDSWRGSKIKEREVRYAIRDVVPDETLTNQILEIVKHQDEY